MLAAVLLTATASSCSSFLDINNNPNSLTSDTPPTPALMLAQALNTTANNYSVSYNSYANFAVDYWGKSGVVSGYAEERTYNYTSNYYANLWSATYDNLNDYQYIQTQGTNGNYAYHAAVARIMKAYNYLLLVDQYGNIPYTQALKGRDNTAPTYDRAETIYDDLLLQLQGAITDINATSAKATAAGTLNTIVPLGPEDVVFNGGTAALLNWKRFANSLQLRILLRESQTKDAARNASVATKLAALQTAADGFITADVAVNPGYLQSSGQQNPFFTTYGLTAAGGSSGTRYYQIPTRYVLNQYVGNKDPRVSQLYAAVSASQTANNPSRRITATYVGATTTGATASTVTTGIYSGTNAGEPDPPGLSDGAVASFMRIGNIAPSYGGPLTGAGILKGLNAPTPLMLLSEHLFNRAEAEARSLFTGGDAAATTNYNSGVLSSFLTFYRTAATPPGTVAAASPTATPGYPQYTVYMAANTTNPLVTYSAATSTAAKISAILFQKYLAENSIASTEALADYRRTGQPAIMISVDPQAQARGKVPYRLFYPQSELNTNSNNVPQGVTQYSPIFWQN